MATKYIIVNGTTVGGNATGSFVIPSDFLSLISIEAIGCPGINSSGTGVPNGGGGYSKTTSITGIAAGQTCYWRMGFGSSSSTFSWLRVGTNSQPTASTNGVLANSGTGDTVVGGRAVGAIGSTVFAGGNGGSSAGYTFGGGGGAGGPNGAGGNGGNGGGSGGGGGGGSANGGSVGSNNSGTTGGNGGNNRFGTGGGAGGLPNTGPFSGGNGDNGAGGGGSGYRTSASSVYGGFALGENLWPGNTEGITLAGGSGGSGASNIANTRRAPVYGFGGARGGGQVSDFGTVEAGLIVFTYNAKANSNFFLMFD